MTDLDRDVVYERSFYRGNIFLYLEYEEQMYPGGHEGWTLGFSGPGLTSEYAFAEAEAERMADDWDFKPRPQD